MLVRLWRLTLKNNLYLKGSFSVHVSFYFGEKSDLFNAETARCCIQIVAFRLK